MVGNAGTGDEVAGGSLIRVENWFEELQRLVPAN